MTPLQDAALCLIWLVAALALRTWVLSLACIRGQSMMDTLRDRERAFVWRLTYRFRAPRRQEVVICHFPGRHWKRCKWVPQCFVKRVIGLPGDTIEFREGVLYVNDAPLDEPYLNPARARFMGNRPPVTLGEDEYYVLGDNRDRSSDSRRMGPIRRREIRGRVLCVFWPLTCLRRIR